MTVKWQLIENVTLVTSYWWNGVHLSTLWCSSCPGDTLMCLTPSSHTVAVDFLNGNLEIMLQDYFSRKLVCFVCRKIFLKILQNFTQCTTTWKWFIDELHWIPLKTQVFVVAHTKMTIIQVDRRNICNQTYNITIMLHNVHKTSWQDFLFWHP